MKDRKLFCLIKETDLPESHAGAGAALEKMVEYRCGCGWPDRPCLKLNPDMRNAPTVAISYPRARGWQLPWNAPRRRARS